MQFHGRTLLHAADACGRMEPVTGSVGATAKLDDECSVKKSSAKPDGFALIVSGSTTE
jgi:hypothetical protein